MKVLWIVVAYLLLLTEVSWSSVKEFNTASQRMNPILQFIASIEGSKEFALYTIMSERCARYVPRAEVNACKAAVDRKLKILDFDILLDKNKAMPETIDVDGIPSFVFIAFKKNLEVLLDSPRTTVYLRELQQNLNGFLRGEKSQLPNVWEITIRHFRTEDTASAIIAALFQDVSPVMLHLAYLDRKNYRGNQHYDANRDMLELVIRSINQVLDTSRTNLGSFFFPPALTDRANHSIYHFYVPVYLARALEKSGMTKRQAFLGPLMMTLTYEFVTADSGYRYILLDPPNFPANDNRARWSIGDIYNGYTGALFGTGELARARPQGQIRNAFVRSTREGVNLLITR